MMLAAMLKPRALATSFAVVPSEHFFQRSGKKRLSIVNATATTPAVEEGSRHRDEGIQRLTIVQPDDWHLHLRDGEGLTAVAPLSAGVFRRAIIMPNLKPPVTDLPAALAYRDRIMKALPSNVEFEPLMTLYLTDVTTRKDIKDASESGVVKAIKLYPAGATTNSQAGVTDLFGKCMAALEEMVEQGLPLLVHGEVADQTVDIFDREKVFIETVLTPLRQKLPKLKIVMEHITTEDAVAFVESNTDGAFSTFSEGNDSPLFWILLRELHPSFYWYSAVMVHMCRALFLFLKDFLRRAIMVLIRIKPIVNNFLSPPLEIRQVLSLRAILVTGMVAATVTPQHLLMNRNALFQGGLQPHNYCLPVLKRETHRRALVAAVTSGSKRFFLGTDSAPHERHAKEASCGCAGIFSAPIALPLYAEAFEQAGALDKLEGFASLNGADFYGLPRNSNTTTLIRKSWHVPTEYGFGPGAVVPMWAGQALNWNIELLR